MTRVPKLLIMPDSRYMQRWDVVTIVALLFTAVVTPFEVALLQVGRVLGFPDACPVGGWGGRVGHISACRRRRAPRQALM